MNYNAVSPMQMFLGSLVHEKLGASDIQEVIFVHDNAEVGRTSTADLLDKSLCHGASEETSRRERRLRKSCERRWLPSSPKNGLEQTSEKVPPSPPKRRSSRANKAPATRWSEAPAGTEATQGMKARFSAPTRPRRYKESSEAKHRRPLHKSSKSIFLTMVDPKREEAIQATLESSQVSTSSAA